MGQAVRTIRYDRAANEANAISVLKFGKQLQPQVPLKWHRLDDGVMGGQSESHHEKSMGDDGILHFTGTINTNGGGFCSIRAPIVLPPETKAIRLVVRGDGKTYKCIMTNRERGGGGPFSSFPSFQADVATIARRTLTKPTQDADDTNNNTCDDDDEWQEVILPLDTFVPAFGGRMMSRPHEEEKKMYKLHTADINELGLMLSLKLSDGSPNPKETFGEGIFPFSLYVKTVEPVV